MDCYRFTKSKILTVILSFAAAAAFCMSFEFVGKALGASSFIPAAVTDQTPTAPLSNPTPSSFQPRYISGFGSGNSFTVFFEDRDAGGLISYATTTSGPTGLSASATGTNIYDTHFLIKDWPITIGSTTYAYRAWGSVGNNPDHHFYVSNDLINWTLVSTFTIPNASDFTGAKGSVYYGFHDVILLNGTYYAFAESNQSQTMIVRSANGDDVWEAFDSVGGIPGDGPLELPSGVAVGWTPSGSFVDLGYDRGYGKIYADPRDSNFYLAINTAAKASLAPAALEAAFINPANWTWHDGTTGPAANPILSQTAEHDLRECWVVPNSDPDADWVIVYDADFGSADGGKALGYATLTPPVRPAPTTVYIDDDYDGLASGTMVGFPYGTPPDDFEIGYDAFATIQEGIDAVSGSTVNVAPGTYIENLIIDKSLTLSGAGESSTYLFPAVSLPNPCAGSSLCGSATAASNLIVIQASDVTIHDMTLDGDNTSLTSGIVRSGADLDTRNGIVEDYYSGTYNNLEVYNVTVKNIYLRGIYASSGGTGFNIHHNTVQNVNGEENSIAIMNFGGSGIFSYNNVSDANDGIVSNWSQGTQYLNNTVANSSSGIHTDNNQTVGDLLQGNSVSNCKPEGYGVWVFVPYVAPTVDQNTVTDCEIGLSSWGEASSVVTIFTNNIVDGPSKAADSVGVYITTDLISWGYSDISIYFEGNVIKDNETALVFTADEQTWNLEPYEEKTIAAEFYDNFIEDNTNGVVLGTDGTYNINASGNWWGSNTPATVKTIVNNGIVVDYTPWLVSGTDTSTDPGFQGDFSTLWVDDDSPQTGSTGRIQEGISAVSSSTVNIALGTYNESIIFDASFDTDGLNLVGDSSSRPIITGGVRFLNTSDIDGISFQNLHLKGVASGGDGVFDMDQSGAVNDFVMDNCVLDGEDVSGRNGMLGQNLGQDFSITNSEFMDVLGWALMDINSGSGDGGNDLPLDNVNFNNNYVHHCDGSIALRGYPSDQTDVVNVFGNTFETIGDNNTVLGQHWAAMEINHAVDTNVYNNLVSDVAEGEWGEGQAFQFWDISNLDMYNNVITGNFQGIYFFGGSSGGTYGGPYAVPSGSIYDNCISGNEQYGISVQSTATGGPLDAEDNWWGDTSGPYHPTSNPSATGDEVSDNIDYNPWLDACPLTSGANFQNTTTLQLYDTLQDAVDDAQYGETVIPLTSGPFAGSTTVAMDGVTIDLQGRTFTGSSPALTISADDVSVVGPGTLDGWTGSVNNSSPGVLIEASADNFLLENVEVKRWQDGVQFAGAVESLKIIGNWLHSNTDAGLQVDSTPTGVVTIEGNLFKVNGGDGVLYSGTGNLDATYNSWGDLDGPNAGVGDGAATNITSTPWTFSEIFLDINPDTLDTERIVAESESFDVALKADAEKLYGLSFKVTYDMDKLTWNSTTFSSPWAGNCTSLTIESSGTISYYCSLSTGPEWDAETGVGVSDGTIATFNFTADLPGEAAEDDGYWESFFDVFHDPSDTSSAAVGGVKVYVNNAGFNAPSTSVRDITDTDDGVVRIDGIANFAGFIDLQGRGNDSGGTLQVFDQETILGSTEYANGSSASSGKYTTSHLSTYLLTIESTYWFQADASLYLPTTAVDTSPSYPTLPTLYTNGDVLEDRPLTGLLNVQLLGGDANDNDVIDITDAGCIGDDYGVSPSVCGSGTSDVNGDGKVDILDLTLMGGNYDLVSSPWSQTP